MSQGNRFVKALTKASLFFFLVLVIFRLAYVSCRRRRLRDRRNRWIHARRDVDGERSVDGHGSSVEGSDAAAIQICNSQNQSTITTIPIFKYKKPPDNPVPLTCSICLGEPEEGELVRALPNCAHIFHAECIDMWLSTHLYCPLCRARVEPTQTVSSPDRTSGGSI